MLLYIVGVYSWDKIISISYNFYQTTYYSYKYEYKKSKFEIIKKWNVENQIMLILFSNKF